MLFGSPLVPAMSQETAWLGSLVPVTVAVSLVVVPLVAYSGVAPLMVAKATVTSVTVGMTVMSSPVSERGEKRTALTNLDIP